MALTVRASVVDIRTDNPQATDRFLTDTNVWLWMGYGKISTAPRRPFPYQLSDYPNYISKARKAGSRLFRSGLSLLELAHLIEGFERNFFETSNSGLRAPTDTRTIDWMRPKDFRHQYPAERAKVTTEIELAWGVVSSLSDVLPLNLDDAMAQQAIQGLKAAEVDGYDILMAEGAKSNGITQILTDDSDYATLPGATIFTASTLILSEARTQNKLTIR